MNRNTSARRYRHVVIVGIDGMGSFCRNTETPRMDAIFQNGAKTTDAQSMFPTISAQNWGAMLLGAAPEIHGLTNGGISQTRYHSDDLPSIFATVREAYPDAVLCSVSNWAPINGGIIEDDRGVEMQETQSGEETTDNWSLASYHVAPSSIPDLYGGFGLNFGFKGFDCFLQLFGF